MDSENHWGTAQRRIADIWLAIKITGTVFFAITGIATIASIVLSLFIAHGIDARIVLPCIMLSWLLSSWFIVKVWVTYSTGIVIDAENSTLSFPATDVENSIIDILMLKPLFNHARRETIRLASISSVMNETRVKSSHYAINISGSFGSRQLLFHSKQKRDEFRATIDWATHETGARLRQDRNLDVGGYHG